MKNAFFIIRYFFIALLPVCFSFFSFSQNNNIANTRAKALLQQMTLEEKVGQMAQITVDVLGKQVYNAKT